MRNVHSRARSPRGADRGRQNGAALVVGLLLLLVLTILAISGMTTATLELQMAGNEQYQERAFQFAEAGIEQAMAAGIYTTDPSAIAAQYTNPNSIDPAPIRGAGTQIADCPDQPVANSSSGECEYFLRFDQAAGITPVPGGGFSLGTGLQAYHFVVDGVGVAERGAQTQNQASFYIIGPGGT
jgi:type IV pilus assembly protein PilX